MPVLHPDSLNSILHACCRVSIGVEVRMQQRCDGIEALALPLALFGAFSKPWPRQNDATLVNAQLSKNLG